jgi:biopolymer transport protein ExbD
VPKDYVSLKVRQGNAVFFNEQYVPQDEVLPRLYQLHQANPNIKVSLSADGLAMHGDVITLLDEVRRVGITKIGYQIRTAAGVGGEQPGPPPPPPPAPPKP